MSEEFGVLYTLDGMVKGGISREASAVLEEDVMELEQELCRRTGVERCVMVPSVPMGLHMALRAAGIQAGDHVLCSGFAPEYHIQAILLAGARPMLVDINPNTFNLDPYLLDYTIGKCIRTKTPLPKAVITADMFGLPCNYERIGEICHMYGLAMISDASESLGGKVMERSAGSGGKYAVVSLAAEPHIVDEGECGALLCHSVEDEEQLRRILRQNRVGAPVKAACGDSVCAGMALDRLAGQEKQVAAQRMAAQAYRKALAGIFKVQHIPEGYESSSNRFVAALFEKSGKKELIARMQEQGILCEEFSPARWEADEGGGRVLLMNAKTAYEGLFTLPINPYLGGRVAEEIAQMAIDLAGAPTAAAQVQME